MAEDTTPAGEGTPEAGKTFTQADLDRVVGERLAREREKHADYDDLKTKAGRLAEIEAAQQTETEKLTGKVTELEGKLTPVQQENMRLRVAMEKKLDPSLVDRLRGTTKEELEKDADSLLELVSPTPRLDGGARTPAPSGDFDSMIRAAAGHS